MPIITKRVLNTWADHINNGARLVDVAKRHEISVASLQALFTQHNITVRTHHSVHEEPSAFGELQVIAEKKQRLEKRERHRAELIAKHENNPFLVKRVDCQNS